MKYIFEQIYDIPFQNWTIDYIESEFDETRAVEQEMSEEAMQKRDGYKIARYALIAAIVLAAILYILCWA